MAKVFHLKINEPENGSFYYPGSYIHGTVFLKVDKPLKIRGLRLKFKCVEHVYFQTPYEGRNSRGHSGTIEHFNEKITLLSDANGNDSFEFNGEACFPFSIRFSESTKLPMTLNVPGGSIVYSLKSYLDIPWRIDWNTRTYELEYRPIMLVNPTRSLDIDEIRESGCCFSSGPVGLKGKIYPIEHCTNTSVPIHIDFTISNHSKLTISRVFASIDIKKELWAGRYSNTDSVRLSEYNPYSMITINPYETKKVQFQLTPNLEYPTRTEGIIRFFYTFNFEIHFRGCNLIMIFEYKMNVGNTLEIPIIQRITPSAPPMESSNGIQIFVEPCKIGEFSESPPPYVEIEEKNE